MWSNFRDVRSIAEKISSVVAPPLPDDSNNSEEYYNDNDADDGEDEEYEEDEEEINYEEEHDGVALEPEQEKISTTQNTFGFVGLLTRAMDQSEQLHAEESEESYKNRQQQKVYRPDMLGMSSEDSNNTYLHKPVEIQSDDDDDDIAIDFESRRSNFDNRSHVAELQRTDPLNGIGDAHKTDSKPTMENEVNTNLTKLQDNTQQTVDTQHEQEQQEHQTLSPRSYQRRQHLPRYDSMDDDTEFVQPQIGIRNNVLNDTIPSPSRLSIEEPVRFSLVRESGSVSPQRATKSKVVLDNRASMMEQFKCSPQQLSSRSLGSTPCGKEVLLSPLRDILQTEVDNSESRKQQDHLNHHFGAAIQQNSNGDANLSMEGVRQFPRDSLLGSFSVPNEPDDALNYPNHTIITDDDHVMSDESISRKDDNVEKSKEPNVISRRTTRVDSGVLPARYKGNTTNTKTLPTISLEAFDENDEGSNSNADSSSSTRHVLTSSESLAQNGNFKAIKPSIVSESAVDTVYQLEQQCKELEGKLTDAENRIASLQSQLLSAEDKNQREVEQLMEQVQKKEACLLQATVEEHQNEIQAMRYEMNQQVAKLQQQLLDERSKHQTEYEQLDTIRSECQNKLIQVESQLLSDQSKNEKIVEQLKQQHLLSIRKLEDKLNRSTALLDERDKDTNKLKDTIKQLELKLSEQEEGANEAQEDVNELHNENDLLHDHIERLQAEAVNLRDTIAKMEGDSEKLLHAKMELRLLKEEHDREKAKIQTVAASAESSTAQVEAERDQALATVNDLQIQLSAAIADIEVVRSDCERIAQANANLQSALEAFQSEREAEIAMMEENHREREHALSAKHAAILDATHEACQAEMRQLQRVSDTALGNSMEEIKKLNEKVESYRLENVQTRRSLDEAIKRLQTTQDDVIDRTFMKNILLDWLTKHDRKEKVQVLELMASVLHFSEEEKGKVHIDEGGALRKLVAPPPPKVDIETLEGDNVREKWVNFLIAEADD